jgi:O-antigen/teichoic acid export membrane protein
VSTLRLNVVANFAGRGWTAALSILFPPIYARLMGVESYGLVGIYTSLVSVLAVLDLGLSATLNRELARQSASVDNEEGRQWMRDTARTFEFLFWIMGLVAGGALLLLAPAIASGWIHAERLPSAVVVRSIRLMGVVLALQWPMGSYNGGLLGLQKQISSNALQIAFGTLRFGGAALILWKVSATIQAFLLWQGATYGLQTIATGAVMTLSLPEAKKHGSFHSGVIASTWRFSLGMSIISLVSMPLVQADKAIVSKLFTLEQVGYYTLASSVGVGLTMLSAPIFVAVLPRLSQLVSQSNEANLKETYHTSCQLASAVVLPIAVVLTLFSREVLLAWSGDPHLVSAGYRILALVSIGYGINGVVSLPYALQLAYGWTRLGIIYNVGNLCVIIPLELWLASKYGIVGPAVGWAVINVGYFFFMVPLMHRRLLRTEKARWYLADVGYPLAGILFVVVPLRLLASGTFGRYQALGYVTATIFLATAAAVASAPALRLRARVLMERWVNYSRA